MEALDAPRRLLLVHAHPDDETIGSGATMARYASSGAHVALVTCTRGERGEVVEPSLVHLEGDGPALAEHRTQELATAMEALGVEDHRFLDDAPLHGEQPADTARVRYEDSGMAWGPGRVAVAAPDTGESAFARADLDEAAARLAGVLRAVRPQVLVTYEPGGGYGHPDHVRAHDVAVRAVELAEDPGAASVAGTEPWSVAKVYENVVPRSQLPETFPLGEGDQLPSMVVDDDEVTAVVEAPEQLEAKVAALRAHRSQVRVRGAEFLVAHDLWQPVWTTEAYRLVRGVPAPAGEREDGREGDLFAGLDTPGASHHPIP
ncbi:N-acetyl-1-D-myo-inositol-2-amino-2-deoxy-alpha-D-glucopyranoside deacetylase [Quadrisphaera sp. DSM 44207]|uniref:N-acetyl-1-D-myo-inositol-2-amino-2-deoxy-alpha- D-glucopyranoside deacetylase n=1 Tax=Quadrisphaera sp. DSM 44207 TaxID=1881057 RepID=UPI000B82A6C3